MNETRTYLPQLGFLSHCSVCLAVVFLDFYLRPYRALGRNLCYAIDPGDALAFRVAHSGSEQIISEQQQCVFMTGIWYN